MKRIALLTMALAMAGCSSTTIKNLDAMQPVNLKPSDIMPSKQALAGKPPRVVVFEGDHGSSDLAKSSKVGATIAREIEKQLAATHVELVDRKLATKLQQELRLAEMKGKAEYQGPEIADIAIVSVVSNASTGSSFTESTSWVDDKGRRHTTPPQCTYGGSVSGSIRVYQMPSMRAATSIELNGKATSSEDSRSSNCGMSKSGAEQMVRAAAANGISSGRSEILNIFAPRGYVIEQRSGDGKHILKITLGSNHGLKRGMKLDVFSISRSVNPLTNEASVDSFVVGNAFVSDKIGNDNAWVIIDKEMIDQVRLGQPVQVQFKKTFMDELKHIADI